MTPRERRYCRCPRRIASSGRCWQINVPKSIGRWGSVNIAFGSQYGQSGQPCPVWESRAGTDASYEACAGLAIDAALAGPTAGGIPGPEVMLATHNRASVQAGVDRVTAAGRAPSASTPPPPVYFGQLLGMADGLTFPLATSGWASFKYVPYGPVRETTAYLVRRAPAASAPWA